MPLIKIHGCRPKGFGAKAPPTRNLEGDNHDMHRSLSQWLDYQQQVHPKSIDMGLERIAAVAARLRLGRPAKHVVTVAGTNGKGSTVAFIEAIARANGLRVGAYTSPHLLRYNERVRIDGNEAGDDALTAAFARIEAARLGADENLPGAATAAPVALTYFEFGTLAAWLLFDEAGLDLAVLEVGLGGRLDATNIIDPDVAVITTVDLDHQDWLGADREAIGAEKAGILRAGRPAVLAERDPPSSVLRRAYALGAFAIRGHADYLIRRDEDGGGWRWHEPGYSVRLPLPALDAPAQLENAAAAIAALRALPIELRDDAIRAGIESARAPGRLQVVARDPEIVVDVGHNPQAARQLAQWLEANPRATHAVFSALADKDIAAIGAILEPAIGTWHVAGIGDAGERGLAGADVATRLGASVPAERILVHGTVAEALAAARRTLRADERLLVFGSFHTAADALRAL
jgi:dihydrofolate synthase/folylpolyglutamate synthase